MEKNTTMVHVTHFIDGQEVLTRQDLLATYPQLNGANIQHFLEKYLPTVWVVAKNKYYYLKTDIDWSLAQHKFRPSQVA